MKKLLAFLLIPFAAFGLVYSQFSAVAVQSDGTATNPAYTWAADNDNGLYRIGANNVGFTIAGTKVLDISATGLSVTGTVTSSGVISAPDGAVTAPGLTFTNDLDCGWYRIGANNLGFALNGSKELDMAATGATFTHKVVHPDGAAATPSVTFSTDATDTGFYLIGANNLGIAANGAKEIDIAATGTTFTHKVVLPDGAAATPGITFTSDATDTGLYYSAANTIGVATNGASVGTIDANSWNFAVAQENSVGAVGTPSITFTGDTDTGLYHPAGNGVSIVSNGAAVLDVTAATSTFTGVLSVPLGAVGTPTIYPGADTNTGIYSAGADQLNIATAGAAMLDVGATGMASHGTVDIGTAAAYLVGADNDNQFQVYVDFPGVTAGAYNDAVQITCTGSGGDGTGGLRPINIVGESINNGSYAEVYGVSAYALQHDGTHTVAPTNLYHVLVVDNEDTSAGDVATGYTGVFGIIDNTGGQTISATVSGGLIGCIKDAAGNAPLGAVVAFVEGDTGASPNNPTNAYFKAMGTRSTATDIPAYGLDLDYAALVPECRVADIRLQNEETISNLTDGTVNIGGNLTVTGNLSATGYSGRGDYITYFDGFDLHNDADLAVRWDLTNVVGAGTNVETTNDGWNLLTTGGAGGPDSECTRSHGLVHYRAYTPRIECVVDLGAVAAGQNFCFGFYAAGNEYVEVIHEPATSANWLLRVDDTGGADTIDSGVAATTNPTKLEIAVSAAGAVTWAIDDTAMTVVGLTNAMTANQHYVRWILTDVAAAVHTAAVDYYLSEQLRQQ